MKLIFFGTPEFAAEILQDLVEKGYPLLAVVTQPDKPQGRSNRPIPSPVKVKALQLLPHIPIFQPQKACDPEFLKALAAFHADLFVVVAYGQILKQALLDIPPLGAINTHASLLPKFRGAAPIQRALMEGVKESGVTIMKIVLELDAGDMLYQLKTDIPLDMNAKALRSKLCALSKEALTFVLENFQNIKPIPQNPRHVTFAPKITLQDGDIDWNKSALHLHNVVRALPDDGGAFCNIWLKGLKKIFKIYESEPLEDGRGPGQILGFDKKGIIVGTKEGALKLIKVQIEGKKIMTASEFACGYKPNDIIFINELRSS